MSTEAISVQSSPKPFVPMSKKDPSTPPPSHSTVSPKSSSIAPASITPAVSVSATTIQPDPNANFNAVKGKVPDLVSQTSIQATLNPSQENTSVRLGVGLGAGVGAFMGSAFGAFVGPLITGGIIYAVTDDDKKGSLAKPSFSQGAKSAALGSLPLSALAIAGGITGAIAVSSVGAAFSTGFLNIIGGALGGAVGALLGPAGIAVFLGVGLGAAILNTSLSALGGGLGSWIVGKFMKDKPASV